MFKLIIKKQDQSIYWTEYFDSLNNLNTWLDEEKTRPYWTRSYATEIINIPSPRVVETYADKRLKEYPPLHEYIEAAYEKYELNRDEKMLLYDEKIKLVKLKYPKSEV